MACGSCKKNKVQRIIQGYKHLLKKEKDIEEIAKLRINICKLCSDYKLGICTKCGCVIAAKARVKEEKCILNKW